MFLRSTIRSAPAQKQLVQAVHRTCRTSDQGRPDGSGGAQAVEAAKQDGRWAAAYDSTAKAAPPKDFLARLAKNKKAKAFFESLNKANKYPVAYRLQTAKKPQTREQWMS